VCWNLAWIISTMLFPIACISDSGSLAGLYNLSPFSRADHLASITQTLQCSSLSFYLSSSQTKYQIFPLVMGLWSQPFRMKVSSSELWCIFLAAHWDTNTEYACYIEDSITVQLGNGLLPNHWFDQHVFCGIFQCVVISRSHITPLMVPKSWMEFTGPEQKPAAEQSS
jgi:hypothetical protein